MDNYISIPFHSNHVGKPLNVLIEHGFDNIHCKLITLELVAEKNKFNGKYTNE